MTCALTDELKRFAAEQGADLVGIAPIERFDGTPPEHHPASIFPEVKSVIVLGRRITRGCLRGVEEGTQLSLYATYANNWVPHRFLAYTTVSVASFLEDHRFEAVPLPNLPPETPATGVAVRPGLPAPNVMIDFVDAAVRAGLGQIGLTGELMTPEFGPLQRLQAILTDADLEPSPLCTENPCDQCGLCAESCPLTAIDPKAMSQRSLCGLTVQTAAINRSLCERCQNGARPNPQHRAGQPDRIGALCMRSCVDRLWREHRLRRDFRSPFRTQPAWAIGPTGVPSLQEMRP